MTTSNSSNQGGYQDVITNGSHLPPVEYEAKQDPEEGKGQIQSPVEGVDEEEILEKWNTPRINLYRYLSALFSFIIMGMNDAAYGVSTSN